MASHLGDEHMRGTKSYDDILREFLAGRDASLGTIPSPSIGDLAIMFWRHRGQEEQQLPSDGDLLDHLDAVEEWLASFDALLQAPSVAQPSASLEDHRDLQDGPGHWTAELLALIVEEGDAESATDLLIALTDSAPDEEAVEFLGAWLAEGLLYDRGSEATVILNSVLEHRPLFRRALAAVWTSELDADLINWLNSRL